jgi:predicted nucleic acid-binding protein
MANPSMTTEISRLVLDANIMVSALMGHSFPILMKLFESGTVLLAPLHQIAETRDVLQKKSSYTDMEIEDQMGRLLVVVMPMHPLLFERHETSARARLHERGQPDWPVLAASIESGAAIWSHDKDFFGSGAPVWSTRILLKQLEHVSA